MGENGNPTGGNSPIEAPKSVMPKFESPQLRNTEITVGPPPIQQADKILEDIKTGSTHDVIKNLAQDPGINKAIGASEEKSAEEKTQLEIIRKETLTEDKTQVEAAVAASAEPTVVAVDAAANAEPRDDNETNKVDEKAALRAQTLWLSDFDAAEGTDAEKEAIADQKARERQSKPVTEGPGEAIEELRDDLAGIGGFDAVEPARTDPTGTREADEEAPESTDKPPEEEHAGDYLAYQDPRGGYIGIPANSADYAIYKSVIDEANQNGETPSVEEIQGRVRALREAAEDTAAEGVSLAEPATGEANVAAASAEPTVVADEAAAVVAPDSAAVVEPTVTGSPEATPDPNKPPIRVDSQGRRFADNGPGKNQPEYRSFQQAHAELITSGKPFTETDVRNRATELRTQELTEEQEKLQAAKKNESAPPPPNAPGGPETGTNRPSPQAERAASLAKIDEQLKDKNLSATERAALMAQKQELRKDPDAEVKKLKEKFDKGEDLSEDEIRQVAEFDTREAQASPVEAAPTVPELSDSEKLDALYQELTNYGSEAMNKMMNGEDPTELVVQFQEKFLEANKLTQSVAQKEQNRAFMEGVFKKDLAKKLNPEQSQRQKNISEKLQELTQLQLQLTAAKETIKTYKQSEKHQQGAVNSAARNLGTGNEKEQLKYQMEYNAAVMGLTNTQEMIRKQVNIGRELKAKRMSAVNYIHRKTGVGSPLGNMLGFMAAGAYGMYAEARYDIDVDI